MEELKLTKIEDSLIVGLQAREREVFRDALAPLQDAYRHLIATIEHRLGLPPGSIGKDYQVDQSTGVLTPVPKAAAPELDLQASSR